MDFEFQILDFIRNTFTSAPMDAIMKFITFFGNAGWFWIVLSLVLAFIPKTRKIGITACCALLFSLIFCNLTLKPLVARIRPYDLREIALIIEAEHDFSFPSGHTSASFAAAVSIFYYDKKWFGISALVFATLIAFSRLYLYVHFPTDILGGLVLGIICATLAFFTVKFGYKKFEELKTK